VSRSSGSKDTERVWHEQYVKRIDRTVQRATLRKLELIHAAIDVNALRVPPGPSWNDCSGTAVDSAASASTRSGVSASSGDREVRTMSNSSTTTESDLSEPIHHPGEILTEDVIEGFGITQNKLAVSIGLPPRRINEIVHGQRGITADTAIRLARYFGTSEEFWMNLQSNYELRLERRALREKVAAITPLHVA